MDWSLVIFVLVVVFFGYRGYKKGLQRSLSRVLSLLAGYIAAILYAPYIGSLLELNFNLQGIAAIIVASLLLFFAAGIAVSILFWIIEKLMPRKEKPSSASSYGGAAVGTLVGLVIAIAIVWTIGFARGMAPSTVNAAKSSPTSDIEHLANQAASKAVNTAMKFGAVKPQIAKLSAALIESPAEVALSAQKLSKSNDLKNLLNSPENQAILDSGDVEAVRNLPAFKQLVKNPDLLALARSTGMVDTSGESTSSVEAEMANQVTDIWGRVQRVQNDKRVQSILNDPEFQQKIQSGNPIELLTNTKLLELADIIFADDAASSGLSKQSVNNAGESGSQPKKIYSWVDENGKKHYSDEAPD